MIDAFVKRFEERKDELRAHFSRAHPDSYRDLVTAVVEILADKADPRGIDPTRIHEIDDGDCEGTLVYVIPSTDYAPYNYWYILVGYGSCSGCDTLLGIRDHYGPGDEPPPSDQQVSDYMAMALHVVQGLKCMGGTAADDDRTAAVIEAAYRDGAEDGLREEVMATGRRHVEMWLESDTHARLHKLGQYKEQTP